MTTWNWLAGLFVVLVAGLLFFSLMLAPSGAYSTRAMVTEGLAEAEPYRSRVAAYYEDYGTWPGSLADLRSMGAPPVRAGIVDVDLEAGTGALRLTFLADGRCRALDPVQCQRLLEPLAGRSLRLSPSVQPGGEVDWHCAGIDLEFRQLPASCR